MSQFRGGSTAVWFAHHYCDFFNQHSALITKLQISQIQANATRLQKLKDDLHSHIAEVAQHRRNNELTVSQMVHDIAQYNDHIKSTEKSVWKLEQGLKAAEKQYEVSTKMVILGLEAYFN